MANPSVTPTFAVNYKTRLLRPLPNKLSYRPHFKPGITSKTLTLIMTLKGVQLPIELPYNCAKFIETAL